MIKFLYIIAGLMFIGKGIYASEMLYHPVTNTFTLKTKISYTSGSSDLNDDFGKSESDFTDISLNFLGQYGYNKNTAIKFGLGYGNLQSKEKNTPATGGVSTPSATISSSKLELTGLNPLFIGVQYRSKAGEGLFKMNGSIIYGISKKDEENRTFGNIILGLGLGYEFNMGPGKLGFKIESLIPMTDLKGKAGGTIEADSEFSIGTFYEIKRKSILYGLYGSYLKTTILGLSSPDLYFLAIDPESFLNTIFYAKIPFKGMSILPEISISKNISGDADDLIYGINIGFRYHF